MTHPHTASAVNLSGLNPSSRAQRQGARRAEGSRRAEAPSAALSTVGYRPAGGAPCRPSRVITYRGAPPLPEEQH
jgi:hypothetical protein